MNILFVKMDVETQADREKRNDNVLALLENLDTFGVLHESFGKSLSDAFFQLAMARKSSDRSLSAEDVRFDIEPVAFLSPDCHELVQPSSSDPSATTLKNAPDNSSLIMISAMPPPALRRAQTLFAKALQSAVDLAARSRAISQSISEIQEESN